MQGKNIELGISGVPMTSIHANDITGTEEYTLSVLEPAELRLQCESCERTFTQQHELK